jgi:predicted nucleotidyltransferase
MGARAADRPAPPAEAPPEARVVEVLARFPEVRHVYLFGSRARGDHAPRADIDLAVSCPDAGPARWARIADTVEEEAWTLLPIDLLRLEDAPPDLRDRILSEGRLIHERKD